MTAQAIPSLEGYAEGGGYATPLISTILTPLRVAPLFTYPATSWHPSKEGTGGSQTILNLISSQFKIRWVLLIQKLGVKVGVKMDNTVDDQAFVLFNSLFNFLFYSILFNL